VIASLHPTSRAALWMSGALFSLAAMAIAGRELSGDLSTFQILFFRSLIGVLVLAPLLFRAGWKSLRTNHLRWHALRSACHFGGQYGWFYGLGFIPLAEVFAIEFTVPVWTAILAAIFLGERLSLARMVAIAMAIGGVLIIVRPGSEVFHPAALAVLMSAIFYGTTYLLTKKLSRTEAPLTILFYMSLIQIPLGLLPSLAAWVTPTLAMLPFILIVALTALSAHYCITKAMTLADATIVVPLDTLRLPLIALIGAMFYGERLHLGLLIGAVLIVGANLVNLYFEQRKKAMVPLTRG